MHNPHRKFPLVLFVGILGLLINSSTPPPAFGRTADQFPGQEDQTESRQASAPPPEVSYAVQQDVSPPLSSLEAAAQDLPGVSGEAQPLLRLPKSQAAVDPLTPAAEDPVLQSGLTAAGMPTPRFNFEGTSNVNNILPPDPNGDVGLTHYVQWVNLSMAIWELDRSTGSATLVYGPATGNTLWRGFGGACEQTNDGDPIILYDHLAGRWLASQFALPNDPSGPYYQCLAVSSSEDPTGAWNRYAFLISQVKMNDYPHLGVWPDGYYMTINQFNRSAWAGAGVVAFEREKMLAGLPARQVYFDLYSTNPAFGGMLPADLDGPPPPAGAPNYFAEVDDSLWISPEDAARIWEFRVDWSDPAQSTFGDDGQPNTILPVASFTPLCTSTTQCVPQAGTAMKLDAVSDRLMHRLQYRNYGDYETLLPVHTVDAGGGKAGVRWYELRRTNGSWGVHQQGTYAGSSPDGQADDIGRWMASAAFDRGGNLAAGYSASSTTLNPSIRYAGRLAGDPPGVLAQGEVTLMAGGGSQLHSAGRWGDYSSMSVDPVDDCTFWFSSEYYASNSNIGWRTRIGSFTFPSCLAESRGYLEGQVQDAASGEPIAGAQVEVNGFSTVTGSDGHYQLFGLPEGLYTIRVYHYGHRPQVRQNVQVQVNPPAREDFFLQPAAPFVLSGRVTDGSGQGWPLYARLAVSAPGFASFQYTDPLTGEFALNLIQGVEHTLVASAPGYETRTWVFTPSSTRYRQDLSLSVESQACSALGYSGNAICQATPGALVMGHVRDGNTGAPLNSAQVQLGETGIASVSSQATPDDPNLPDGFYQLFLPDLGEHLLVAQAANYVSQSRTIQVSAREVLSTSFRLPAGLLNVEPAMLAVELDDEQANYTFRLTNQGSAPAAFHILEVNAAQERILSARLTSPARRTSPKRLADMDAHAVYDYVPPETIFWSRSTPLAEWPSHLAHPWGIGVDYSDGSVWLADAAAGGGDDHLHQFGADGAPLPGRIAVEQPEVEFGADMAYDTTTATFWQVMVGSNHCLVEIDPRQQAITGRSICPPFDHSQRGLAYNPRQDTFFSGSWNSGLLYQFDTEGRILESVGLGLNISGLAYNPSTRHLFVLTNAAIGYDVYILDEAHDYAVLGGFDLPGMGEFEQAGLEIDCQGRLWAANQTTGQVVSAWSGEAGVCDWQDITWLDSHPQEGLLAPGASQEIVVTLDTAGARVGRNQAQLVFENDNPYGPLKIPIDLTFYGGRIVYLPRVYMR